MIYLPKLSETVVGAESAGNWSQLVYACGLVLTLIVAPSGLVGDLSRLARRATEPRGDVPPVLGSHARRADEAAPGKQMSDLT
ncbi:hypothetical protein [Nonomuraea sp. SYSU D8015]|uniref:hypothetical protein n=1 Tax=Nonomuraea sp. SYSU D8015 TaxID=2593644 RepID=UPI00166179F2|nr:hypothetical protein [Nonomuraea sp. SYSU D8015]